MVRSGLCHGRFYGYGHFYETGMMKGKRALLSLTTGGPCDAYSPGGFNGDISSILRPINRGMFGFVGFEVLAPQVSYAVAHVSREERGRCWMSTKTGCSGSNPSNPSKLGGTEGWRNENGGRLAAM